MNDEDYDFSLNSFTIENFLKNLLQGVEASEKSKTTPIEKKDVVKEAIFSLLSNMCVIHSQIKQTIDSCEVAHVKLHETIESNITKIRNFMNILFQIDTDFNIININMSKCLNPMKVHYKIIKNTSNLNILCEGLSNQNNSVNIFNNNISKKILHKLELILRFKKFPSRFVADNCENSSTNDLPISPEILKFQNHLRKNNLEKSEDTSDSLFLQDKILLYAESLFSILIEKYTCSKVSYGKLINDFFDDCQQIQYLFKIYTKIILKSYTCVIFTDKIKNTNFVDLYSLMECDFVIEFSNFFQKINLLKKRLFEQIKTFDFFYFDILIKQLTQSYRSAYIPSELNIFETSFKSKYEYHHIDRDIFSFNDEFILNILLDWDQAFQRIKIISSTEDLEGNIKMFYFTTFPIIKEYFINFLKNYELNDKSLDLNSLVSINTFKLINTISITISKVIKVFNENISINILHDSITHNEINKYHLTFIENIQVYFDKIIQNLFSKFLSKMREIFESSCCIYNSKDLSNDYALHKKKLLKMIEILNSFNESILMNIKDSFNLERISKEWAIKFLRYLNDYYSSKTFSEKGAILVLMEISQYRESFLCLKFSYINDAFNHLFMLHYSLIIPKDLLDSFYKFTKQNLNSKNVRVNQILALREYKSK